MGYERGVILTPIPIVGEGHTSAGWQVAGEPDVGVTKGHWRSGQFLKPSVCFLFNSLYQLFFLHIAGWYVRMVR